MKQLLEKQEREFEEKFNKDFGFGIWIKEGHPTEEKYYTSSVLEWTRNILLSQKIEMLEKMCEELDNRKKRKKYVNKDGTVKLVVQNTRYTQALTDTISTLQEVIKTIR